MKKQAFSIFRHAMVMVSSTLKSYVLLSVTIVLSFSLLLGYMLYTDSSIYHSTKWILHQRRGLMISDDQGQMEKATVFTNQAQKIGHTTCFRRYKGFTQINIAGALEDGTPVGNINTTIYCLPDSAWGFFKGITEMDVTWLPGFERNSFHLKDDEMLIGESLFYALQLDQMSEPTYRFQLGGRWFTMRVVGLVEEEYHVYRKGAFGKPAQGINPHYTAIHTYFAVSLNTVNPQVAPDATWYSEIVTYTDSPELIHQLADSIGYQIDSYLDEQNAALEMIRSENRIKAILTAVLGLILGVNLYSCFTNVLNDRKFEIGVKRAIGASAWSIVRQFMYEGIIVMSVNTLISIVLIANVVFVYKLLFESIPDELGYYNTWTLYLSPYSAGMFAACAVGLTLFFSLIFAYKSTQVEIVQYLKAE